MKFSEIRQSVLARIKPSKEEAKQLIIQIDAFTQELSEALRMECVSAHIDVGGSSAKGTWLKDNHDVDVFVKFPKDAKDISDVLEKVLTHLPDDTSCLERIHGSRDYFQLTRGSFVFEIVPVLNITGHKTAQNVTDMSPLHVAYVKQHLTTKLQDDVRLAKQFAKANRVYGAESYIGGFSGHVLELLVIEYGGFFQLSKAAASWRAPVVIDPMKYHKDPRKTINAAKLRSPLTLVDPVQPERNAAAALSEEAFNNFINASKKFASRPSLSAFTLPKVSATQLKRKRRATVLEIHATEGKRDVSGSKALKAFEYLVSHLEGFTVTRTQFFYDDNTKSALACIVTKEEKIPGEYMQKGPPINAKKGAEAFKKKHGAVAVEKNGHLHVPVQRLRVTVKQQVRAMFGDSPVTSRVKKIKIL